MKKAFAIITWILIATYTVVSIGFIINKNKNVVCNDVNVIITDSLRNAFVSEKNIKNLLRYKGVDLVGINMDDINIDTIENILNKNPLVDNAEAYKTNSGKLVIQIKQRFPVIRIIDANNDSYYIDDKGCFMRLSERYTSHVIIANGNINAKVPTRSKISVLELEKYSDGKRVVIAELYKLAKFINESPFWTAQIEQIYVNQSGDIELIPMVGSHVIILGDFSNCEKKFENLLSLYHNGLPAVGWNKYESINLKYKGQVICTKREIL